MATCRKPCYWLAMLALCAGPVLAAADAPGAGGAPDFVSAAVRMSLGLAAVLALLGGTAWLSRRYRISGRLKSGLIEVISGISLGAREKVVLIRVGKEQVLVGVSPSGMRTLHVITEPQSGAFSSYLEDGK